MGEFEVRDCTYLIGSCSKPDAMATAFLATGCGGAVCAWSRCYTDAVRGSLNIVSHAVFSAGAEQ